MSGLDTLEFVDEGPHRGRRKIRELRLGRNSHTLPGTLTRTLPIGRDRSELALVVPYPRVPSHLPRAHLKRIEARSEELFDADTALHTRSAVFKNFLLTADATVGLPNGFRGVPWAHGPIPVVELGVAGDVPVYVTPVVSRSKQQELATRRVEQSVVSAAIGQFYPECMDDYFWDLSDLLISLFFSNGRSDTRSVARHIRSRLHGSVLTKVTMFTGEDAALAEGDQLVLGGFHERHGGYYTFSSAAAKVFEVVLEQLAAVSNGSVPSESTVRDAYESLGPLEASGFPAEDLRACLNAMAETPAATPAALRAPHQPNSEWLEDLRLGCRFLGEVRGLQQNYDSATIKVFVSQHMDTYSASHFYERVCDGADALGLEEGSVTFWTGEGREEHILLSILAKIWLSDVQILFIPNALTLIGRGDAKELSLAEDWVVDELAYGAGISKALIPVVADDSRPRDDSIRAQIIRQLRDYDWDSLHPVLKKYVDPRVGPGLADQLSRHLHDRTYTTYEPRRKHLGASNARRLRNGVLGPAVDTRVSDLLLDARLGFRREEWAALQALHATSLREGDDLRHMSVGRETVLEAFNLGRDEPRGDSWLQKKLHRLSKSGVWFDGELIPLVRKSKRVKRFLTYEFALHEFAAAAAQKYSGLITIERVEELIAKTVTAPLGSRI